MSRSTLSYGPMPVASTSHSVPRTFPSNLRSVLDQSFDEYTKQTGVDLAKCDFAKKLETCDSLDEIVWLLNDKAKQFKEYRDGNRKLINCISPIAQTVHVFAGFLGEALSVVSPTALIPSLWLFNAQLGSPHLRPLKQSLLVLISFSWYVSSTLAQP